MKDEVKAIKAIEKTEAAGDSEEGNKPTASDIVERANTAAERLENATKNYQDAIRRQEELMAKQALGGMSEGPRQPEEKKEESPKEFKDKFMKGEVEFPK